MRSVTTVGTVLVATVIAASAAMAQDRPQPADEEKPRKKTAAPQDQPGWIERQIRSFTSPSGKKTGFFVAFGGIKTGSGFALGPGFRIVGSNGATLESKGAWSVRNFKLAQVAVTSRPLLHRALTVGARARWQDAPLLAVYAMGNGSEPTRGDYAETMTEASVNTSAAAGWLRFDASGGVEWFATGAPPHSRRSPAADVFPAMPGMYLDPEYVHISAGLALDTRDGDSYSRHGSLAGVMLHRYQQVNDGALSFDRVNLDGQRYVPVRRLKAVVYLGTQAAFTSPRRANNVPFFLMPTLGGSDTLRGYSDYRFRDRHALALTAEYRWLVQHALDVAFFFDAGKVAETRADLNLRGLHRDAGIGVRLHGRKTTALRLDLARGAEGLRLVLAFGK